MLLTRDEAFEYLTLAADQIGADWAKQRVSWIPDEVNRAVERAVDLAMEGIGVTRVEWGEIDYMLGRRRSRSREELRVHLIDFTRNTARDRKYRIANLVLSDQERVEAAQREQARLHYEQRLAESRLDRERVEAEQRRQREKAEAERRERERLAEAERRELEEKAEAEQRERERLEREQRHEKLRLERERAEAERRERWLNRPAPPPGPQQ